MNILLIHQAFVTTGEAGGTRHIEFARRLIQRGHKVTIITSPVSYLTGMNKMPGAYLWKTEKPEKDLVIHYCFTSSGMHKGFVPRLFAFFTFMISSFFCALSVPHTDLIWGTSPNIFQAWTAWFVSFLRRKPFLLEIRDLWPEFAVAMGSLKRPILIRMSLWLEKFLYDHADRIIVNSPGFIPHIQNICGKISTLVANGADSDMFLSDDTGAAFRKEHGLNRKFIVMYSGAHGPANDLGTVLRAANYLKEEDDIRFVFVGSGKDKETLIQAADEMELQNVLFIPPVSKSEMANILAASDAGLAILKKLDMFKTTYPNKVFDIMASSRPVICQIDGVIREVVETNNAGVYVEPGNARALADTILALSSNPDECKIMGENGRTAILNTYSREKTAAQLEEVMISMLR